MELSKWNVKEYRIADPEGNEAVILYRPITQGWRARHLETSLQAQKAFAKVGEASSLLEGEAVLSEDEIQTVVSAQKGAFEAMTRFQRDMLQALVIGSRDLTINGQEPEVSALIDLMVELEEPATELMNHILEEGSISEPEGKDSGPPSTTS